MATFIPADPEQPIQENVKPKNGQNFTLREMQSFVGGMIEILDLPDGNKMVLNEESKCVNEPVANTRVNQFVTFATAGEVRQQIAEAKARGEFVFAPDLPEDDNAPADYIAGDVLICTPTEAS